MSTSHNSREPYLQAEAARHFRSLIAKGLESGEGRRLTDDVINELRAQALDSGFERP